MPWSVCVHRFLALIACVASAMFVSQIGRTAEVISLASRRELFVDHYLIDGLQNARLTLHHPKYAGVALKCSESWEGPFSQYFTIIPDGDVIRMYYRGLPSLSDNSEAECTCYAESRDGITWTKPALRLFEVNGSRENNIVLHGYAPASHNFAPFLDRRPGIPRFERFKALGGSFKSGLLAFVSEDGLRWRKLRPDPVITDGAFDSLNVAFWSESEECYVCYFRAWSDGGFEGVRTIHRATSQDFVEWSKPVAITFGSAPAEQLYTNQFLPYFRAPHLYFGLAMRFIPNRQSLSIGQIQQLDVVPEYQPYARHECTDGVLITTRGGNSVDRTFLEAFMRPGLDPGNWVSRSILAARGIVPTGASEMSMYYEQHDGQPSKHLARFTMRYDGFASVHSPYEGGELITKPIAFSGEQLFLNCSTSAAGGLRIELQDVAGSPLPGYSLEDSIEFVGDSLEHVVSWKNGSGLEAISGQPIRIRFVMRDADLYSMQFRERLNVVD